MEYLYESQLYELILFALSRCPLDITEDDTAVHISTEVVGSNPTRGRFLFKIKFLILLFKAPSFHCSYWGSKHGAFRGILSAFPMPIGDTHALWG